MELTVWIYIILQMTLIIFERFVIVKSLSKIYLEENIKLYTIFEDMFERINNKHALYLFSLFMISTKTFRRYHIHVPFLNSNCICNSFWRNSLSININTIMINCIFQNIIHGFNWQTASSMNLRIRDLVPRQSCSILCMRHILMDIC